MSFRNFTFLCCLFGLLLTSCQKESLVDNQPDLATNTTNQTIVSSEDFTRNCASTEHTELLLQDKAYKKNYENRRRQFQNYQKARPAQSRAACNNPTLLPVAIHFQGVSNNANATCLASLAQAQIASLNDDFQGTNGDINQWNNTAAPSFPGISNGEACIEFKIATADHPSGYGLANGDLAITINQTSGDANSDWAGYINIYVRDEANLGYSPVGGSGNGDGVVIDDNAFGSGNGCESVSPNAPYDLGRTLTHEMGHYLYLNHIWGTGNGGCINDDGVADTPDQDAYYGGCPSIGAATCSSTDMHMNFLDYVNDACMYMFSAGQATRVEDYINATLINNLKDAATAFGTGGTCTDNDGDGVCAADDCNDNDPNVPTAAGTVCDDGDAGTINDVIQSDGCTCAGETSGGTTYACDAPTNVAASPLNATAVEISFTKASGISKSEVNYRVAGTTNWTSKNTRNASVTFTGLATNTDYEASVRSQCSDRSMSGYSTIVTFSLSDGGSSGGTDNDGDGVDASQDCDDNDANIGGPGSTCDDGDANTTNDVLQNDCSCAGITGGGDTGACDAPSGVAASQPSSTEVEITYNAVTGVSKYKVEIREQGTSTWTSNVTRKTKRSFTGLTTGATYEYQVSSQCTSSTYSAPSALQTITLVEVTGGGGGGKGGGKPGG